MKEQHFLIELKQPVIISQQAATAGTHQSLDYISGSAILGLSAGKLYADLSLDEAFLVFHSGKVRFLNAFIVQNNEIALPVPMSLHHFKGESYDKQGQLIANQVFDVSKISSEVLGQRQPVQLRGFYISTSGQKLSPNKEQTLKTAIDKKHNRAAQGQLFGYEALSAGQKFCFCVQADDIDDTLWQKVLDSLKGAAHLGRSRSSQFGKVNISPITLSMPKPTPAGRVLTLWLLSDVCLHNEAQPTLLAQPEFFGLPIGTKWLSEQSFVRTRRYSSFNNYRKHYDKERQVITQGSVLRFELPVGANFDEICQQLSQGVGLYTEQGLGQVAINPSILKDIHPTWQASNPTEIITQKQIENPNTLLIAVLQKRAKTLTDAHEPKRIANDIFMVLCEKIAFARRFHGLAYKANFESVKLQAPSRTQFGMLKDVANRYRDDKQALWRTLSNSTDGKLYIKPVQESDNRQSGKSYANSGWELTFGTQATDNLGDFLLTNQLSPHKDKDYFPQIVAELAVLGMSNEWQRHILGLENLEKGSE